MEKVLLRDAIKEMDSIMKRLNNKIDLNYSMPYFIAFKKHDEDLIGGSIDTAEFEKTSIKDWTAIDEDYKRYMKLLLVVSEEYDHIQVDIPVLTFDGTIRAETMSVNRAIFIRMLLKTKCLDVLNTLDTRLCMDLGMKPTESDVIIVDPNNIIGSNIINNRNTVFIDMIHNIDHIIQMANMDVNNYVYL